AVFFSWVSRRGGALAASAPLNLRHVQEPHPLPEAGHRLLRHRVFREGVAVFDFQWRVFGGVL
ncbi:hypothetical protein, partial [Salmonella enterica]|uniref:hypothetical protein n=1 Tax=Salmonella enterica TaxID=28901 RepID=UPI003CF48C62